MCFRPNRLRQSGRRGQPGIDKSLPAERHCSLGGRRLQRTGLASKLLNHQLAKMRRVPVFVALLTVLALPGAAFADTLWFQPRTSNTDVDRRDLYTWRVDHLAGGNPAAAE